LTIHSKKKDESLQKKTSSVSVTKEDKDELKLEKREKVFLKTLKQEKIGAKECKERARTR
jgi:hypothetical protein